MALTWPNILLLSFAIGCGGVGRDNVRSGAGAADGADAGGSGGNESSGAPEVGSDGHTIDPDAGIGCNLAWRSGFETGFPGSDWLEYDNGSYSPEGTLNPGRTSGWTIVERGSGEPVFSGDHSYRGWIEGTASESHRA
jgi:hypothetical protein